jgi:hypothetical protein
MALYSTELFKTKHEYDGCVGEGGRLLSPSLDFLKKDGNTLKFKSTSENPSILNSLYGLNASL